MKTVFKWNKANLTEKFTDEGKLGKDVLCLLAFNDHNDPRTYLGALAVYNRGAWRDPNDWEIIYNPSYFAILKIFPFENENESI